MPFFPAHAARLRHSKRDNRRAKLWQIPTQKRLLRLAKGVFQVGIDRREPVSSRALCARRYLHLSACFTRPDL